MKRKQKSGLCLLLAVLFLAGCKTSTPTVSLGSFEASMPGTVTQDTEQLPLTQMGLGVNTPLVMTTAQTTPESDEVYIAIAVEWEQTLIALSEKSGQQWDEKAFTDVVQQSIVELLTMGASVGEGHTVTYGGYNGVAMPFVIEKTVEEDSDDWEITQGEVVSFVTQKRLIMLVYMAEQSTFSASNKEEYFSSLVVYNP